MTTIGKYRHLSQCSTPQGHFVILAIDHRANLLESLNKHADTPLTDMDFTHFKQEMFGQLEGLYSAVLADPMYGFGPGIAGRVLSGQVGILSPVEVTDYTMHPSQRETNFIPDWSVAKIKRVGGSGVKLLLYYHPQAANAQNQRDLVSRIVDDCTRYDIPFYLEPITYSLDPQSHLSSPELHQVSVEMARTFSTMGVDVLKMQFPIDATQESSEDIWIDAVKELDAACSVPWALLSAGVDYATFVKQVSIACQLGASGVIVGRAVWAEATTLQGHERETFLKTTARERMEELATICLQNASPWYERVFAPEINDNWLAEYTE